MSGMFGRWQKMLESEAFKAAFHPQGAEAALPEGAQAAQAEGHKNSIKPGKDSCGKLKFEKKYKIILISRSR